MRYTKHDRAWVRSVVAPFVRIALATVIGVASYPVQALTPEEDFAARCAAPGVVLCEGFDTATDIAKNIQPAGDGTIQGSLDNTTKTSGAGSLRFTLRAGVSDPNIGGSWEIKDQFSFAQNETIYVQWAMRVDSNWLSALANDWQAEVKNLMITGTSSLCQGAELTNVVYPGDIGGTPQMYTNCGDSLYTYDDSTTMQLGPFAFPDKLLWQQASDLPSGNPQGFNCYYNNQYAGDGSGLGCFVMPADTWVTFYGVYELGTQGGNDTTVTAFVSVNGGPYKQFMRITNVEWAGGDNAFSWLRLETYCTDIAGGASSDAHVWYDELIVSTEPIAKPGAIAVTSDGDLNGDGAVDVVDVLLGQRIALGLIAPTASQLAHGDVAPAGSPNGVIDVADVLRIQQKALGLVSF